MVTFGINEREMTGERVELLTNGPREYDALSFSALSFIHAGYSK